MSIAATLDGPLRMRGRSQANILLANLPDTLEGLSIEISFQPGTWPSASFLDEIVRVVLMVRGADQLVLSGADDAVTRMATQSAEDLGVASRLVIR